MRWRMVMRLRRPLGRSLPVSSLDGVLDAADDLLALVLPAVDEQPTRALGDVPAHEQDADGEDRAEPEGKPPAHSWSIDVRGRAAGW